jgi:hypothetical protein
MSSADDLIRSCVIIRYLWNATVRVVTCIAAATSFIVRPVASSRNTSCCLSVRAGFVACFGARSDCTIAPVRDDVT